MKDISDRLSAVAEDDQKKRLVMDLTKLIVHMLNKPYVLESERLLLEGEKKGFEQGEVQSRRNLIANALQRGTTPEQLIHLMGISEAEILECQKELEGTK